MSAVVLSDEQRGVLAGLADVLIPEASDMPSASQIGVQDRWVDRVLAVRPDLAPELVATLAVAAGDDPDAHVKAMIAERPEAAEALLLIVMCAYYMSPKVRKRLGYPGQKPQPPLPDEADHYLRDGLLDPVIERGPIFRPTDAVT